MSFLTKTLFLKTLQIFIMRPRKWIGIAPFASYSGKTYPLDLMQQVIAYLQKDFQIFLFGAGQNEIKKLEVWEKAYTNVFNTSGKLHYEIKSNLCLISTS